MTQERHVWQCFGACKGLKTAKNVVSIFRRFRPFITIKTLQNHVHLVVEVRGMVWGMVWGKPPEKPWKMPQ